MIGVRISVIFLVFLLLIGCAGASKKGAGLILFNVYIYPKPDQRVIEDEG